MRCLNCNTVVADSDPRCMSCGAKCTTPVRLQGLPVPIPIIAVVLLFAGIIGYGLANRPDRPRNLSKEEIRDHKTNAYLCGLGCFFLGLGIDAFLMWLRRRGRHQGGHTRGTPPEHKASLMDAFATPNSAAHRASVLAALDTPSPMPARQTAPVAVAGPPPRRRHFLVRAFFGVMWAVVFFIGTALVTGLATLGAAGGDQEAAKQLGEEVGDHYAVWFFLGSIGLTIVLGSIGFLPGTRRFKR